MHHKGSCMQSLSHVMHLDDDVSYTRLIARHLKSLGYLIVQQNDPRKVEEQVIQQQIGVVILDLDMPWRHGLEVLESLRRMPGDRRVIVVSGCISVGTVINAMALGADYLFFKNRFDVAELAEAIASLQSRRRQWLRGAVETAREQRTNRLRRSESDADSSEAMGVGEQAMWNSVASRDESQKSLVSGNSGDESRQIRELLKQRKITKAALGRAERLADQLTPTLLQLALGRGFISQEVAVKCATAANELQADVRSQLLSEQLLTSSELSLLERQQDLLRPSILMILAAMGCMASSDAKCKDSPSLAL